MAVEAKTNGAAAEALDTGRLDDFAGRARRAAEAFRRLDQEAVDRIVREMVVGGKTEEIARGRLFERVEELLHAVGMPTTLAAAGVGEDEFRAALPELVATAFADPSMRTNPRMPLLRELEELLVTASGFNRPGSE